MKTNKLDPLIYKIVKENINNGKDLKTILKEYENTEFKLEIIAHYYHINDGTDLRNYQKGICDKLKEYYKSKDIFKLFWCCGLGKTKNIF